MLRMLIFVLTFIFNFYSIIYFYFTPKLHFHNFVSLLQNFRQGYCRFKFDLVEQLEEIMSLGDCQSACGYTNNCSYFLYDVQKRICSLSSVNGNMRNCDITIGTPSPDFQTCLNNGKIEWTPGMKTFFHSITLNTLRID